MMMNRLKHEAAFLEELVSTVDVVFHDTDVYFVGSVLPVLNSTLDAAFTFRNALEGQEAINLGVKFARVGETSAALWRAAIETWESSEHKLCFTCDQKAFETLTKARSRKSTRSYTKRVAVTLPDGRRAKAQILFVNCAKWNSSPYHAHCRPHDRTVVYHFKGDAKSAMPKVYSEVRQMKFGKSTAGALAAFRSIREPPSRQLILACRHGLKSARDCRGVSSRPSSG